MREGARRELMKWQGGRQSLLQALGRGVIGCQSPARICRCRECPRECRRCTVDRAAVVAAAGSCIRPRIESVLEAAATERKVLSRLPSMRS